MILVIDPSIETPAIPCFNYLKQNFSYDFVYHSIIKVETFLELPSTPQMVIVFGSASNLDQELPWHRPLKEYLRKMLINNIPVLGICFGHQLICQLLGADVIKNPGHTYARGLRKITFHNNSFSPNNSSLNLAVEHGYQVSNLPKDFEIIASSYFCQADVVVHKKLPFVGIQAHPEASDNFYNEILKEVTTLEAFYACKNDGMEFFKMAFRHFSIHGQDQLQHQ